MIDANSMTPQAEIALRNSGANITEFDDENIVLVDLPGGTIENTNGTYTLPDGTKIGFHQEGDYVEGWSTICLK